MENEIYNDDDDDYIFDKIMLEIGYSGNFQKIFNYIFNIGFVFFATMASFNMIIVLSVPDHWCYVPGNDNFNYTIDRWKSITIPKIDQIDKNNTNNSNNNEIHYNKCTMYINYDNHTEGVTDCQHGWEYDRSYFENTLPSQEHWVCNESLGVSNAFAWQRMGEILGTSIFGQLGDIYGRRPVFYASLFTLVVGRTISVFVSHHYYLLLISLLIGNLSGLSLYQSCLVIAMEISSDEDRGHIALLQCISWTFALCFTPALYWFAGDWATFILASTIPLLLFLSFYNYMIESPRWLANKGKIKECIKILKRIAKKNKVPLNDKIFLPLSIHKRKHFNENQSTKINYGIMGLLSSWLMAKKTIFITIEWVCNGIIYTTLFLNISNLDGNPYLNYFWQGLAELPGYITGKYLSNFLGRKLTIMISFFIVSIFSFILSTFMGYSQYEIVITILSVILKLLTSCLFYAINLQTIELYPTCVRQSGTSFGYLITCVFGLLSPYIIYIGTHINPGYPYIISSILGATGCIISLLLPETLHERLPETLKEAEEFGSEQKPWDIVKLLYKRKSVLNNNDNTNLNK